LKERLLEAKQTFACVGDLLKKFTTKDNTKLLGSQRVGPESGQLGVIGFKYLIVPLEQGNVSFNMCYCI
jgi:hypothetical protein